MAPTTVKYRSYSFRSNNSSENAKPIDDLKYRPTRTDYKFVVVDRYVSLFGLAYSSCRRSRPRRTSAARIHESEKLNERKMVGLAERGVYRRTAKSGRMTVGLRAAERTEDRKMSRRFLRETRESPMRADGNSRAATEEEI